VAYIHVLLKRLVICCAWAPNTGNYQQVNKEIVKVEHTAVYFPGVYHIENKLLVVLHFLYVLEMEIRIEFLYIRLNLSGFSVLRIGKCDLLFDHSCGSHN
jgi:hypothetical protein